MSRNRCIAVCLGLQGEGTGCAAITTLVLTSEQLEHFGVTTTRQELWAGNYHLFRQETITFFGHEHLFLVGNSLNYYRPRVVKS